MHDALASLLAEHYSATVQCVNTLADGQPEQMYDIVLDLSGGRPAIHAPLRAKRSLVVLFAPPGGKQDLVLQLLTEQPLWLAIAEDEGGNAPRILADSCVALPQWSGLAVRLRLAEARLRQLVLRALDHLLLGKPLPIRNVPPALHTPPPVWLAKSRFAVVYGARKVQNALRKPFVHIGQWRLATRMEEDGAFQLWPVEPDSFLADPFLLQWQGETYLFCEEYSHISGRGSIVWARFNPAVRGWSMPRPALVRPWHLSYPFVFRGPEGKIYMLPEQGDTGTLTLYQAERFPDRWQPVADLLVEDHITDATLYRDAQGWWLFCGKGWDELFLYYAEHLLGPYQPHPRNPVKSDVRSARPGGRMYRDADGVLIRPAQDCTRGYGSALALCRIDELNRRSYRETVVSRMLPDLVSGSSGVHTYDHLGGIEVIDSKTTIQRRYWNLGILAEPFARRGQQKLQIAR